MTRRHLALLLIGFIAGIASVKSYPMSTASVELPTAWHEFNEVPRDSKEFDAWWHNFGSRLWSETIKHPREPLWFAGQLKAQDQRAD
jgi:hypothetical protein